MYLLVGCGDRAMTQQPLFSADFGNAVTIRTHHRRADPETSREAAAITVRTLTDSQAFALDVIRRYGRPGSLRVIAEAMAAEVKWGPIALYHELERRAGEMEGFELWVIKDPVTGKPERDGHGRVWRECA